MQIRSLLLLACTALASVGTASAASTPASPWHVVLTADGESALGRGAEFTSTGEVSQVVSQKEKTFDPTTLQVRVGQTIEVVNDDATVHNVFCQSPEFKYNSGPQQPGTRSNITFTAAGTFEIRCAIHPKMKLIVTVVP